jgi:hypothetical protein
MWEHSVIKNSPPAPYRTHVTGTYTVRNDTIFTTIPTGHYSDTAGMTFTRNVPTFASPSTDWLAATLRRNLDTRLYLRR